jgi:hypothetical protein
MALRIVRSFLATAYEQDLARPYVREMNFAGRRLRGIVYVNATGIRTSKRLQSWVDRGLQFAGSLPLK